MKIYRIFDISGEQLHLNSEIWHALEQWQHCSLFMVQGGEETDVYCITLTNRFDVW